MSEKIKDFCLIYYDESMNAEQQIKWSDSVAALAEEAYDSVLLAKKYHVAKIFDRNLRVVYLFEKP